MATSQHEHLFDVNPFVERMFAFGRSGRYGRANRRSSTALPGRPRSVMAQVLSTKRKQILDCISESVRDRGYPPSVREIGESVGLTSSSTVHAHLAVLQREGYLRRDPTKPRAIEVCYDPSSKVIMDARPIRHVAGTGVLAQENVEELYPLPEDFTGTGSLFMLKVRGDSMVGAGIVDGDFVVVRQQPDAERGDIVVAGIPDEEATVQPSFARAGAPVAATSPASSGWSSAGGAPAAASTSSQRSPGPRCPPSSSLIDASADSTVRSGANRWLSTIDASSGTTLPETPPPICTAWSCSAYSHPSSTGRRPR